jgi:hypothetical protein
LGIEVNQQDTLTRPTHGVRKACLSL